MKYYVGEQFEAEWKLDKSSSYAMPDDNTYQVNRALTPNKTTLIVPKITYNKGHANLSVEVNAPHVQSASPDWNKDFEVSWDFQLKIGSFVTKKYGGVIHCEVCLWLDDLAGGSYLSQFNFKRDWAIVLTSKDLVLLGQSIRYLTPRISDQPLSVMRLLVIQGYRAVFDNIPYITVKLAIAGAAINTTTADGGLADGTRIGADLSVKVETEIARISTSDFDPE